MTAQYKDGAYNVYNRWNNYTNYYVETSFRDIYNGGALVEAFIIKTEK